MVDFIQRLNVTFTDADKETCLPVIERMAELATLARSRGLMELENEAEREENVFLKEALRLIISEDDPDETKEWLQILIWSDNHSGYELLSRLIMLKGALMIAAGSNPRLIKDVLISMLGRKFAPCCMQTQTEIEEESKTQKREEFFKKIKEPYDEYTPRGPWDWAFQKADREVLKAALSNIDNKEMAILGVWLDSEDFVMLLKNLDESRLSDIYEEMEHMRDTARRGIFEQVYKKLLPAILKAEKSMKGTE
jgi:hypothetical protein